MSRGGRKKRNWFWAWEADGLVHIALVKGAGHARRFRRPCKCFNMQYDYQVFYTSSYTGQKEVSVSCRDCGSYASTAQPDLELVNG